MKKTVRIAVAIDTDGEWNSCGAAPIPDEEAMALAKEPLDNSALCYWITAEVELPEPVKTVTGAATPA